MTRKRSYLSRQEKGDRVFDALSNAPDHRLSPQALRVETGMTQRQVELGRKYVREVLASEHTQAIVWDAREGVHILDASVIEVEQYLQHRGRGHLAQLVNEMRAAVEPCLAKHGDVPQIRYIRRAATRFIEDLSELLDGAPA